VSKKDGMKMLAACGCINVCVDGVGEAIFDEAWSGRRTDY
jgi:hypothetical protein